MSAPAPALTGDPLLEALPPADRAVYLLLCRLRPSAVSARDLVTCGSSSKKPTAAAVTWLDDALLRLLSRGYVEIVGPRSIASAPGVLVDTYRAIPLEEIVQRRAARPPGFDAGPIACAGCGEVFSRRQESQRWCQRRECRRAMYREQVRRLKLEGRQGSAWWTGRKRDAGPPLLIALALSLLLACGAEARGRPSIPALPSEPAKASPSLRSLRAAHAEAAYQNDPLGALDLGKTHEVRVEIPEVPPGEWHVRSVDEHGNQTRVRTSGKEAVPISITTTSGLSLRLFWHEIPSWPGHGVLFGEVVGISGTVSKEWPGEWR